MRSFEGLSHGGDLVEKGNEIGVIWTLSTIIFDRYDFNLDPASK